MVGSLLMMARCLGSCAGFQEKGKAKWETGVVLVVVLKMEGAILGTNVPRPSISQVRHRDITQHFPNFADRS